GASFVRPSHDPRHGGRDRAVKHVVIALAAAIAMLLLQPPASALSATSTFIPCNDGRNCFIISIDGELRPDDERDFARKIAMSEPNVAVVVLNSPGENLIAGIAIGQIIRSKGYSTVVSEDHKCASACALIWLAGKRRIAERGALIGFHAAYVTNRNGFAAETGMGNALVGAYLKEIGLSYKAIAYLTQASHYQMTWLTAGDAKALGIDAETVDKSRRATQARGLGVKIIPGTKWMISATKLEEDATTCQLTAETNHAEFRVTIGSKGSLVILLRDQYQENAIRDTLGWSENQSYQA